MKFEAPKNLMLLLIPPGHGNMRKEKYPPSEEMIWGGPLAVDVIEKKSKKGVSLEKPMTRNLTDDPINMLC